MNGKTAAMFGLDARIALAIFGALSVITGAALYSAMGKSEAIAVLSDMNEMGKAWEQYYLDTLHPLEKNPQIVKPSGLHVQYYRNLWNLIENSGNSNWKGPYLPYKKGTIESFLIYPKYNTKIVLALISNKDWDVINDGVFCNGGNIPCYLWVILYSVPLSVAKQLEIIIDGTDVNNQGDFRYTSPDASGNVKISLKFSSAKLVF